MSYCKFNTLELLLDLITVNSVIDVEYYQQLVSESHLPLEDKSELLYL